MIGQWKNIVATFALMFYREAVVHGFAVLRNMLFSHRFSVGKYCVFAKIEFTGSAPRPA